MERQTPIIALTSTGSGIAFSPEDRKRHVYIVGKSGSGKSTLLFNLAMQDIHAGQGICVTDPHGDLADAIIDAMPRSRVHDTCYLNVADTEYPVGFNPLADVPSTRHALAAAGIVSTFKHIWSDSWGHGWSIFSTLDWPRFSRRRGQVFSTFRGSILTANFGRASWLASPIRSSRASGRKSSGATT
jgi:energy-coupling factor transporter ATP-binding protein EcfA2